MTFLHGLSYVAAIAGCLFVTLSLASGLLWLSELIEEHTKMAKIVGTRAIYIIILIHVVLWLLDSLPITLTAFSIFCHLVYLQNFSQTWPFISLISPSFIGSCILVIIDHFVWFHYFAQRTQEARMRGRGRLPYQQQPVEAPVFMDIAAFFAICVWLVPLFLFLSLSANDNALPTASGLPPRAPVPGDIGSPKREFPLALPRKSLLAAIVDPILAILPRIRRGDRRNPEGIIAPRTPIANRSPLHTPMMAASSLPPWTPSGNGHSDFDLLTTPLSGHPYPPFEASLRKSPSMPLRNPPKRTNTAPPGQVAGTGGAESSANLPTGLGIRPVSRNGRRLVHGPDDLTLAHTDSPVMR